MKKTIVRKIRVLLVDDHPIVREGIKFALSAKKNISVVGEAATGEDGLTKTRSLKPDVILLDINLPGMSGIETARRIRKLVPGSKILALTMHENREYILEMSQLGARGYVFKDSPPSELLHAIEAVHAGELFFSPRASQQLLKAFLPTAKGSTPQNAIELSKREKEVLRFLIEGLRTREISTRLGITIRTAETYRARLMMKLGVHTIASLIKLAISQGLLDPES